MVGCCGGGPSSRVGAVTGLSRRVDANESRTAGKTTTPPVRPTDGYENPCIPDFFTGLPYMLAMVTDVLCENLAGIFGSDNPVVGRKMATIPATFQTRETFA